MLTDLEITQITKKVIAQIRGELRETVRIRRETTLLFRIREKIQKVGDFLFNGK